MSALFPGNEALQSRDDVVYFGGPVARQELVFLVRSNQAPPRAARVLNDVYFTSDAAWIKRATQHMTRSPGPNPVRAAAYR